MFASRHAQTWRQYENSANRLHRTVAEAAHNTVLLALFDTLNAVRRAVVWGRLRDKIDRPPPDHHSFKEHELLVRAIQERDMDGDGQAMLRPLSHVQANLLTARHAAQSAPPPGRWGRGNGRRPDRDRAVEGQ